MNSDRLKALCRQSAADPLAYGLLTSYGQLLRGFDGSGFTRDRSDVPAGEYDCVPGMGFQVAAAALAWDMGFIPASEARQITDRSISALVALPREPATGLLPHWLSGGQRHPNSEWSSVDTALACIAAVEGATVLGMTTHAAEIYTRIIDRIYWPAFTTARGEILHGVQPDGTLSPYGWTHWGGELTVVEVLRALSNPELPPVSAHRDWEHFGGRGFIIELAALFFPEFGAPGYGQDRYGTDWHARRIAHMEAQAGFTGHPLFGLSAIEIGSHESMATAYLEGGIGTRRPASGPRATLPGFSSGPWIAPHYMSMVAALDIPAASERIRLMRDTLGIWPEFGPPEAIDMSLYGAQCHCYRLETALNAFFNTAALYHALCIRDSRPDCLYTSVDADPRLRRAVDVVYSGK